MRSGKGFDHRAESNPNDASLSRPLIRFSINLYDHDYGRQCP